MQNVSSKTIASFPSDSSDDEDNSVLEPLRTFHPKPYTFELINSETGEPITLNEESINNRLVSCPEYHILLDHTIACLWNLYSDDGNKSKISPTQLQWAIKFLQEITDNEGKPFNSNDIRMAVKHMEELAVSLYNLVKDEDIVKDDDETTSEVESSSDNYFPTSITLNEMFEKEPKILEKLMEKKKPTGTNDSANMATGVTSKNSAAERIKRQWRDEQYQRIKTEIERLKAIEKLMQNQTRSGSTISLGFKDILDRIDKLVDQTK